MPKHLSKEQDIPLKAGDRVRVDTPGGGGYGDPRERDPELVRRDVGWGITQPRKPSGFLASGWPRGLLRFGSGRAENGGFREPERSVLSGT